jgi:hypothetical protein
MKTGEQLVLPQKIDRKRCGSGNLHQKYVLTFKVAVKWQISKELEHKVWEYLNKVKKLKIP